MTLSDPAFAAPAAPRWREEAPTVALLVLCYAAWAALTAHAGALGLWLSIPLISLTITLHSSLQHEALHGHPFRDRRLNAALVFPALGLFIPYQRFRDTHIAHHRDDRLTDPYDDPESNYLDPAAWARLPRLARIFLNANNTLLGRMVLGPAISLAAFYGSDARALLRRDPAVLHAWSLHLLGLIPVAFWLSQVASVPFWTYMVSAYLGFSLLKIRTFLEHRAHPDSAARTVVVEDRGPLSLLFLNNNFHAVHHAEPSLPWWRLPAAYRAGRDAVLTLNGDYRYPSYAAIFRRHLLRAKDPVPHPLRPIA